MLGPSFPWPYSRLSGRSDRGEGTDLLTDECRKLSGRVEGPVTGATPVVVLGKRLVVVEMQGQGLDPLQLAVVLSLLVIYLLTRHIWVLLMLYLQPVIRKCGTSCCVAPHTAS